MDVKHVPARFPKTLPTKIAFVAEAPSWEEVKYGEPLVGPSGRLFNSLMRTANLERTDYYIGNVFDEKIPENKIKNWCVGIKLAREQNLLCLPPIGSSGYLRSEYHHHLARLKHELDQALPTVIVPLGATALWAFTGKTNIGAMRGTAFPATRLVPGMKLVPTYHPSFIMKKYSQFSIVVRDLQYAASEADKGSEIEYAKRKLYLEPTLDDIHSLLPEMLQSELLSIDIETGWGTITNIGFAWSEEEALNIPFFDQRKPNHSYWETPEEEVEAWKLVRHICAMPMPKVGQNFAMYDLMWLLYRHHIIVKNLREDTRLLSHAKYPELPKDLGFLGSSFASQGAWKYMGRKSGKRDDA